MAEKLTSKRRKQLSIQAERMRAAKAREESILLPGPMARNSSEESSEDDSTDDDFIDTFSHDDAAAVYHDWLGTADREDMKMMAMMLHDI